MTPAEAGSAEAVEALITTLYGAEVALGPIEGALHVAALCRDAEGALQVLAIGEGAPRSAWDAFALNLARARAGAILTTGAILRAEPEVRYTLGGPGDCSTGLMAWRRQIGLDRPPVLAVLTSGRGWRWDHPALDGALPVWVYTDSEGAEQIRRGAPAHAHVIAADGLDAAWAVSHLRAHLGGVCVEAGPSASACLYQPALRLDELMLSIFTGLCGAEQIVAPWPGAERAELLGGGDSDGALRPHASVQDTWSFLRVSCTSTR